MRKGTEGILGNDSDLFSRFRSRKVCPRTSSKTLGPTGTYTGELGKGTVYDSRFYERHGIGAR